MALAGPNAVSSTSMTFTVAPYQPAAAAVDNSVPCQRPSSICPGGDVEARKFNATITSLAASMPSQAFRLLSESCEKKNNRREPFYRSRSAACDSRTLPRQGQDELSASGKVLSRPTSLIEPSACGTGCGGRSRLDVLGGSSSSSSTSIGCSPLRQRSTSRGGSSRSGKNNHSYVSPYKSPRILNLLSSPTFRWSDTQLSPTQQDKEFVTAPPPKTPSRSRNEQFGRLFPDISDTVVDSYHCALLSDMLYQGILFVTPNWFCFHSKVLGKKSITISVMAVTDIVKMKTAFIIPNAVGISTNTEKFVFGSLMARKSTYKVLMKTWQEATSRLTAISQNTNDTIDLANNNNNNATTTCRHDRSMSESTNNTTSGESNSDYDSTTNASPTEINSPTGCTCAQDDRCYCNSSPNAPELEDFTDGNPSDGQPLTPCSSLKSRSSTAPGLLTSVTPTNVPLTVPPMASATTPRDDTTDANRHLLVDDVTQTSCRRRQHAKGCHKPTISNSSSKYALADAANTELHGDASVVGVGFTQNNGSVVKNYALISITAIVILLSLCAVFTAFKLVQLQAQHEAYLNVYGSKDEMGDQQAVSGEEVYRLRHEKHRSIVNRLHSVTEMHVQLLDKVKHALQELCDMAASSRYQTASDEDDLSHGLQLAAAATTTTSTTTTKRSSTDD